MENLEKSGIVAAMSAGNSGAWMENASSGGYLYDDDVSMQTNGTPGTYTNSLAVASVDNRGITGEYVTVGGSTIVYTQSTTYGNLPLTTLAGEQSYVYIDGYGTEADWAAVGEALKGTVAVCSRGGISFYQKANAAIGAGAIATVVLQQRQGLHQHGPDWLWLHRPLCFHDPGRWRHAKGKGHPLSPIARATCCTMRAS